MVTLGQEDKPFVAPWFSFHPGNQARIRYLETLITENGYNRYAYEGIAEHQRIQGLVRSHLKKTKDRKSGKKEDTQPQEETQRELEAKAASTLSATEKRQTSAKKPLPPAEPQ
jgi:hypothetical protein